jgi:hypothetical protein
VDTPEFLLWSLAYHCPIRGFEDGSDQERTERQLRAARAVSDARRAGRVLEGLAVDPPDGFRIDDALVVYGGEAAVTAACTDCPANALAKTQSSTLAGCYGRFIVPLGDDGFHTAVSAAVDRAVSVAPDDPAVLTTPRWYGLWIESPLDPSRASFVVRVLASLDRGQCQDLRGLIAALTTAVECRLPLHVSLHPRGHADSWRWMVAPHCPRCKVTWLEDRSRRCEVCGFAGRAAPLKRRHLVGRRPYFALQRLLGTQQAAEFLVRYEAWRARP